MVFSDKLPVIVRPSGPVAGLHGISGAMTSLGR